MNIIVRIVVGGISGWLTGKLLETEGRIKVVKEGHVLDAIYGIVGGIFGKFLFFWVVIGKGDTFSDYAMTMLGSVTVVGAARFFAERWRRARS